MGRILPFTPRILHTYPVRAEALDHAEGMVLAGMRTWVAELKRGADPMPRLRQHMAGLGAPDAALSLDQFLRIIARTTRRPVDMRCPHCQRLSQDEQRLLHAAALAQAGESGRAERTLRCGLLSPSGAEFALGPLEGLGELLLGIGLILPRRVFAEEQDPPGGGMIWASPLPATLH
jgi:hypothetical protein